MRKRALTRGRHCPKCGKPMGLIQLEGIEVDLCPRCTGMWFDAGELSRASGLEFRDTATGRALAGARRTQHGCPSCAVPLYERELDRGSGIFIDQCPKCSGLFLDRGELAQTQKYFRAKGAPLRTRRAARKRPPRTRAPSYDAEEDSVATVLFQCLSRLPVEVGMATTIFPFVTLGLLVANTVVLVLALVYGLDQSVNLYGVVPAEVMSGRGLYALITSMFVHANIVHLAGNMYFLYVVGDNLEERLGRLKFLGFYLLCGVVANFAHIAGNPSSALPCVGASGAVSGLMGAYVVFFPRARFVIRWFYFFWYHVKFGVPAYGYFLFWVLMQVVFAAAQLPGVAWWAHIGGFACGAAIAFVVRTRAGERQQPG